MPDIHDVMRDYFVFFARTARVLKIRFVIVADPVKAKGISIPPDWFERNRRSVFIDVIKLSKASVRLALPELKKRIFEGYFSCAASAI